MKSKNFLLCLIIGIGLLIGIGKPWFDYPMAFSVGDEFESQRVAIQILADKSFRQETLYLPLWSWIQIPFLVIVIGIQLLFRVFSSISELQSQFILQQPGMYLWIPRILSAIISAGGIFWIYLIGKEIKNKHLGLIMASLYSVDFLRVQTAHFGRHTSVFWFFSLGFTYFFTKLLKYKDSRDLVLSIIFATLATSCYQTGGILFISLLIGFVIWVKKWSWLKNKKIYLTIILCITFIGLLTLLTPTVIERTLNQLKPLPKSETLMTQMSSFDKAWFYTKIISLYQGILVILAIAGFSIKLKKIKPHYLAPIIIGITLFLPYAPKNSAEPRYLLSITLVVIYGASLALEYLRSMHKNIYIILFSIALIYSSLLAIRFNYLMYTPSTYLQAKQWIEKNVDTREPLLINGNNYYLVPTLESQQPPEIYQISYYRTLNTELNKLNYQQKQQISNLKSVRSANNLTYLSDGKDYTYLFQSQNYKWIVLDYFSQSEKNKLEKWFNLNMEYKTATNYYPNQDHTSVDTTLNIKNPWDLFKIRTFGPYIEIYENPKYIDKKI